MCRTIAYNSNVLVVIQWLVSKQITNGKQERDQCPRRRFDTVLKIVEVTVKTNYIIVENSPDRIQV